MKSTSDAEALASEIASLSEIRSCHVAEVYDIVVAKNSGRVGLVQEYVPGQDLSQCESAPATDEFLKDIWQIACGITSIHQHGRIHRDIKPSNLRRDAEGVIKILDFGLTMCSDGAVTVRARGTPNFLAPELFGVPPVRVTKAVDVYAFGIVAWYLASCGVLAEAMRVIHFRPN